VAQCHRPDEDVRFVTLLGGAWQSSRDLQSPGLREHLRDGDDVPFQHPVVGRIVHRLVVGDERHRRDIPRRRPERDPSSSIHEVLAFRRMSPTIETARYSPTPVPRGPT
jgi:hypothetical protein